jgi:hypothetical protein
MLKNLSTRWLRLAGGGAALAVAATLSVAPGVAAAAPDDGACDGAGWRIADASVDGAPARFDAGDAGRTYVWHDGGGWHLRTTDIHPDAHLYTGTVTASAGASFRDVHKVRLDPADRLWADRQVLHYSFVTHAGVDGIDFRVGGCRATDTRTVAFSLRKNGAADPRLIDLGAHRAHPATDPFTVTRGADRSRA